MTKQALDTSGIEISAKTRGPRTARVLTVYIEAPYYRDIEEVGIGRANVLASKRGYRFLSGATVWPRADEPWRRREGAAPRRSDR